jgi:hypothetical protein
MPKFCPQNVQSQKGHTQHDKIVYLGEVRRSAVKCFLFRFAR